MQESYQFSQNKNIEEYNLSPVFCMHNEVVILKKENNIIVFGMINIEDEDLKNLLRRSVNNFFEKQYIDIGFSKIDSTLFNELISGTFNNRINYPEEDLQSKKQKEENEIKVLLQSLLYKAVKSNATDIHIHDGVIRFRIMGQLQTIITLDKDCIEKLIVRIKYISGLNITEKRFPQDGQFTQVLTESDSVSVRVSTLPCISSSESLCEESVALRLLDTNRIPLKIEQLGFNTNQCELIKENLTADDGLILICGPTGSGKSTTASSMLKFIQKNFNETKNIITLEDPPEYFLQGITQIKVEDSIQMSYENSLRYVFRQDPDVIFIGEIRDKESAQVAVKASLTGHLVISTLHCGSVQEVMMRLTDLGIEETIAREVLKLVVVQHIKKEKLIAEVSGDF